MKHSHGLEKEVFDRVMALMVVHIVELVHVETSPYCNTHHAFLAVLIYQAVELVKLIDN